MRSALQKQKWFTLLTMENMKGNEPSSVGLESKGPCDTKGRKFVKDSFTLKADDIKEVIKRCQKMEECYDENDAA